ncbi:MAG: hypothetical protein LJE75_11110 [Gammaproteobacteria bacterium]|jgi:hypothetical protein|nr:hypothetical protein [Gammaproteobacteria bacterium]
MLARQTFTDCTMQDNSHLQFTNFQGNALRIFFKYFFRAAHYIIGPVEKHQRIAEGIQLSLQ